MGQRNLRWANVDPPIIGSKTPGCARDALLDCLIISEQSSDNAIKKRRDSHKNEAKWSFWFSFFTIKILGRRTEILIPLRHVLPISPPSSSTIPTN